MKIRYLYFMLLCIVFLNNSYASDSTKTSDLKHIKTISGKISPKSIVHNGNGLFFAQNMMYKHTVTVYNRNYELIKLIKDKIHLSNYISDTTYQTEDYHRGAPVECVFTHNGKYAWVSNYEMSGKGFEKPGCDNCRSKSDYDPSFVYKINTETFAIEEAIKVGSVPKYLASTRNNELVLISNWTSGDLSIIDTKQNKEIKRIPIGRFPRGIVIDNQRNVAYVAVMGGKTIAEINLNNFNKTYFEVGSHPRHLCIDERDNILYATLNGEGKVAKINLSTHEVKKLRTGRLPRSMDYCDYNKTLYVVNYGSKYLSKIDAISFRVSDTIKTNSKPIGVTIDKDKGEIWVACYSGSIMVFKDNSYHPEPTMGPFLSDYVSFNSSEKSTIKKSLPIKKIAPTKTTHPEKKKTTSLKTYHIIMGSFKQKSNAIRLSKSLQKEYSSCLYFKHTNGNYYVSLSSFNSKENAVNFTREEKSKSNDFKGWILKR